MEKEIRIVNEYGAFSSIELNREYVKCKELLKVYKDIIDDDKKQISELESKLAFKEDLLKIKKVYSDKDCGKDLKAMVNFGIHVDEETLKEFADLKEKGKVLAEPLPFSDEEYEESIIEELEDRHQQDCITINQLQTTIDTLVDRYAKLREMRGL